MNAHNLFLRAFASRQISAHPSYPLLFETTSPFTQQPLRGIQPIHLYSSTRMNRYCLGRSGGRCGGGSSGSTEERLMVVGMKGEEANMFDRVLVLPCIRSGGIFFLMTRLLPDLCTCLGVVSSFVTAASLQPILTRRISTAPSCCSIPPPRPASVRNVCPCCVADQYGC